MKAAKSSQRDRTRNTADTAAAAAVVVTHIGWARCHRTAVAHHTQYVLPHAQKHAREARQRHESWGRLHRCRSRS